MAILKNTKNLIDILNYIVILHHTFINKIIININFLSTINEMNKKTFKSVRTKVLIMNLTPILAPAG